MGKRKANISGLARFVFEAAQDSRLQPTSPSPEESVVENAVALPETANTRKVEDALDTRPKKKPKLQRGLLGPGLEKYDATGLVPFYTDASQVPPHLQKCA